MGSLRLVSGPSQDVLTLDQVKAHLRVQDDDEDELIRTYLKAATAYAESFMGLSLIDQTWDYYFDAFPLSSLPIKLPRSPLIEVLEFVSEGAGFAAYSVDYATEPARLYLTTGASWPSVTGLTSVGRIQFRSGFVDLSGSPTGQVPSDILSAILLIVGTLYATRETVIVGQTPALVPWSADALLRRHRIETSMA